MSTGKEDSDLAATRWQERSPQPGNGVHIMLDLSPAAIAERSEKHKFEFWQLRTPLTKFALAGIPYGLDNGCFSGSLPDSWPRLLHEAKRDKPLWACSPDVVGSARRTLELWPRFARVMNGIPRALVLQDGIGDFEIPWHELAAVFIGGSNNFKRSIEARSAAVAARMLGKWVHVGRVNTAERLLEGDPKDPVMKPWIVLADSIDGSGISRDPRNEQLAAVLRAIRGDNGQACLFESAA